MERNRFVKDLLDTTNRIDVADEGVSEKDVRSLSDLELVLAAGGDAPVCW
jgi:hypothetical protein